MAPKHNLLYLQYINCIQSTQSYELYVLVRSKTLDRGSHVSSIFVSLNNKDNTPLILCKYQRNRLMTSYLYYLGRNPLADLELEISSCLKRIYFLGVQIRQVRIGNRSFCANFAGYCLKMMRQAVSSPQEWAIHLPISIAVESNLALAKHGMKQQTTLLIAHAIAVLSYIPVSITLKRAPYLSSLPSRSSPATLERNKESTNNKTRSELSRVSVI